MATMLLPAGGRGRGAKPMPDTQTTRCPVCDAWSCSCAKEIAEVVEQYQPVGTTTPTEHVARRLDLHWRRTCGYQPDAGHEVTWHTFAGQAEVAIAAVAEAGGGITPPTGRLEAEIILLRSQLLTARAEVERLDAVIAYLELKRGRWTAELMEARDAAIARCREAGNGR